MLLERERILAMAMAVNGIAQAWDRGLLGLDTAGAPPYEREVLGLIGVRHGLEPDRVDEARAGVEEAMRLVREIHDATEGKLRPLDELVDDFALSSISRVLLMVIAAAQLWPDVAELYAILGRGSARPIVDDSVLFQLLPRINPHDLVHELQPNRPLRLFGLVHATTTAAGFVGYAVDPLVLARLRGDLLDDDPERPGTTVKRPLALSELRIASDVEAALCKHIALQRAQPFRLVVRGRRGSGRRTLLAALAAHAGRNLALLDLRHIAEGARPTPSELARALQRCHLAGWIPCLDGADASASDDDSKLRHVIAHYPGPLAMRLDSEKQPLLEPGYVLVDLPDLTESERLAVWQAELATHGLADSGAETAALAARWRVGPGTIHRVVAEVSEQTAGDPSACEQPSITGIIDSVIGQHLEQRFGEVAQRVRHLPKLADMVLPSDILDSLTEFLSRLRHRRTVFEQWGMEAVATTGRGLTALFQGAPGTGKTMVAGALANELGLDLYRVDLSRIMSKWIGETERNLSAVFSAAEESHAIVLFDEADSLFTKRTEVKSSNDRHANVEVNYLLQRLDSFIGVAILTTNFGTAIDAAFKRRLQFRVTFPIPDEELREQLWRAHLPATVPQAPDLDFSVLAQKYELTGGSVRNCVMRAAFLAAAEDSMLTQEHLQRAIRLEYRAAGKLSAGGTLE